MIGPYLPRLHAITPQRSAQTFENAYITTSQAAVALGDQASAWDERLDDVFNVGIVFALAEARHTEVNIHL